MGAQPGMDVAQGLGLADEGADLHLVAVRLVTVDDHHHLPGVSTEMGDGEAGALHDAAPRCGALSAAQSQMTARMAARLPAPAALEDPVLHEAPDPVALAALLPDLGEGPTA